MLGQRMDAKHVNLTLPRLVESELWNLLFLVHSPRLEYNIINIL